MSTTALPERLLYPETEARELLGGISRSTFYRLVKEGILNPTRIGSRVFVSADELQRFINVGG